MVLTLLLACASPAEESAVIVQRSGDTVFVHSNEPVIADTARLESVAQFGVREGRPEEELTHVRAFDVASDGSVVLFDGPTGLKLFSPNGRFEELLLGIGSGPEVDYLLALSVNSDDQIALLDLGSRRLSLVSSEDHRSVRWEGYLPEGGEGTLQFLASGSLVVSLAATYRQGEVQYPRPIFATVTDSLTLRDTIFLSAPTEGCSRPRLADRRGYWDDYFEPFVPRQKWALGEDGSLVTACARDYSFIVERPGGQVLSVSRRWTPVPVSDYRREWVRDRGGPSVSGSRPSIARIIPTSDGRIWVWPEQPVGPKEIEGPLGNLQTVHPVVAETGAFDVFEADGRWHGTVELPREIKYSGYPTTPPVVIRGDTLWAVTLDEFDVQQLTRYLVRWPTG